MIIDLTVENDRRFRIGVGHRLSPTFDIDDGQTPMPQEHPLVWMDKNAVSIRPTVGKGLSHCMEIIF